MLCSNNRQDKRKSRQGSRSLPSLSLLCCRCDRTNKGTCMENKQTRIRTTSAQTAAPSTQTTSRRIIAAAGACKQGHVCRFCNMQQSSCNYIPAGVSGLQQSAGSASLLLPHSSVTSGQIRSTHAYFDLFFLKDARVQGLKVSRHREFVVVRRGYLLWGWSHVFVPCCSCMGRRERRAQPRINWSVGERERERGAVVERCELGNSGRRGGKRVGLIPEVHVWWKVGATVITHTVNLWWCG